MDVAPGWPMPVGGVVCCINARAVVCQQLVRPVAQQTVGNRRGDVQHGVSVSGCHKEGLLSDAGKTTPISN